MDLKKTVNLPRTDFPMKANLPQTEPRILAAWEAEDLYGQIRKARAGRPKFILHDGPPYANGNIHLGHVFNKVLKDFIVKSKTMAGFDSPYVPGWDCHGLPIEIRVDSELGARKGNMSPIQIRAACRRYAAKYVDLQRRDFKRLGILGQWDRPYLTMDPSYQAVIAGAFVDFLEQGYVYKGLRPVHWCVNDRTALAEAEVEYETHSSPSIWVRFELLSEPSQIHPALAGRRVWGLIWTTTPWTIPANLAIAYHPNFEYVAVEADGEAYIVAAGLLAQTADALGWKAPRVLAHFPGRHMEHTSFRHPIIRRESKGILAEHVTLEQGTGAVHTAPGHGHEDFLVGQKYGLPPYCPVDADGRFIQTDPSLGEIPQPLLGKTIWEANPIVIALLRQSGALMAESKLEHSYPHCWRCHNPTIFRATEQWFIGMERNNLRQRALEAIRQVKWLPAWGEERISNMIANRPDWCISRQRIWGVPIIIFYCASCREPYTEPAALRSIVELFRTHSADVWYERSPEQLLPHNVRCPRCGGSRFVKENDILDVWFDSGASHLAVLGHSPDLPWPSDLYLEGGDQYRGWFHSSLLIGVALKGASPYRACATNGWTLDGEGRAMSKSLGNVIEPEKIISRFGAEVLRLWVASVEFWEDVRLSDTILDRLTDAYRKLRNTFRYALGNLADFDPQNSAIAPSQLLPLDQWILVRAEDLVRRCRAWYEEFAFHRLYHAIYDFATTDLSAIYFDILKDRLYTAATNSHARRSAQTAIYRINYALVRLLAPILSFTTEEVWRHMRRPAGAPLSVHLAEFPTPEELTCGLTDADRQRVQDFERLMEIRPHVLKSLEEARQEKFIGAPLEARVRIRADGDIMPLLKRYAQELPALFIVSEVQLEQAPDQPLSISVERAGGAKCERCWKYTYDIGAHPRFPTICRACAEAVEQFEASNAA